MCKFSAVVVCWQNTSAGDIGAGTVGDGNSVQGGIA